MRMCAAATLNWVTSPYSVNSFDLIHELTDIFCFVALLPSSAFHFLCALPHRFTGEIASPMEDYDMDEEDMEDEFQDMPPQIRGGR